MAQRPTPHLGIRHVALFVPTAHFDHTKRFYTERLGFRVEWEPDADNVYLTSGTDNLALHRSTRDDRETRETAFDHLGVIVRTAADVDAWAAYLESKGVTLRTRPRTHRDGARSCYVDDPAGNTIQIIFHPPISGPPADTLDTIDPR